MSCTAGGHDTDPSSPAGRQDICGEEHKGPDLGHGLDHRCQSKPNLAFPDPNTNPSLYQPKPQRPFSSHLKPQPQPYARLNQIRNHFQ